MKQFIKFDLQKRIFKISKVHKLLVSLLKGINYESAGI